ncbi:MAG: acyltransferase family protein [Sandarakinorhabdus sp.]
MTGPARSPAPGHRYAALDALRGICALCVCLFHFQAAGPIATSAFVRGSWLFVDFFFVLSGFVMACSWGNRLVDVRAGKRFALLRLGRVYPLHIVVLLAFLGTELAGAALASPDLMQRDAFDAERSVEAWVLSAAFLQIFGLLPGLSWNPPSWSIAAEFWTYLVFAGLMIVGRRRAGLLLAITAGVSVAVLALVAPEGINATFDFSLWRCLFGFCFGALIWRWTVNGRVPVGGTLAELVLVALVIAFVSLGGGGAPANLLAPLLFGLTVHVFAAQTGWVSQLLLHPQLQQLGVWSYSIYMVHAFVQSRMDDVLRVAAKLGGPTLVSAQAIGGRSLDVMGTTPAMGVLLTIVMLLLVIATAAFTWRFVEMPGQRWASRRAARLDQAPS